MEMNLENSIPKPPEAPTRRHWRDCVGRGWPGGEGDEGESCHSSFLTFPEGCCTPGGKPEFKKSVHTNAFIDSYYPKLQSDFSEDCDEGGKCFCSSREMLASFCVGDSSECSNIYVVSMAVSKKSSEGSLEFWEDEAEEATENRSRTTVGTKTYTLFSNSSDIASMAASKKIEEKSSKEVEESEAEEERLYPTGTKASPTDDWFTQLLVRIDTLEALLQQSLVSGPPKSCEPGLTEGKDNFDTDNELRNIKERVNALEKKLRKTGMCSTLDVKSCSEVKETSTTNSNLTPVAGGRCRSRSQVTPTESDSAALCSPKSEKAINQPQEKKRTKASNLSPASQRNPPTESYFTDSNQQAKKKSISKSKRIKRICSSVLYSSRKYSTNSVQFEISEDCGDIDSFDKLLLRNLCPADCRPETEGEDQNLTVVFVKPEKRGKITGKKRKELCRKPPVINFAPNKEKSKKRKRHKGSNILEQQEEEKMKIERWKESEETPMASSSAERNRCCRVHFLCKRCPPLMCHGCPHWRNNSEAKKLKTRKKIFPNPIEILKRGGQIKIPVLFKEVCKVSIPAISEKTSNISLRFIPVNEPKHPLKKLLKKLPLGPDLDRKYLCGGAKCCCDSEIPKTNSSSSGRKKGSKRVTCD